MQQLLISCELCGLLQVALAGCSALMQPGESKFQAYSGMVVLNCCLLLHFKQQPFYQDDADELESYALMIVQVASSSQQCVVSVI